MMRASSLVAAALLMGLSLGVRAGEVTLGDPYARAVPPGQPNSAVFMTLRNTSAQDLALVEAQSPAAEVVELHTHVQEEGMMRMRRLDRIELRAGETVKLEPGGLHLMLIGLQQRLEPGESVELTLIYDDGSEARIQAPVRKIQMHH